MTVSDFCTALSKEFSVSCPGIRFDVPVNRSAQYSPVVQQIQFSDRQSTIVSITEEGSSAPLRWTLHEFAHHLQNVNNIDIEEEFARWFTQQYTSELFSTWKESVVENKEPNISMDTEYITEKMEEFSRPQ